MKDAEKQDVLDKLMELMKADWDKKQNRPDQYVVAIKRQDNDELVGYHLSTFGQITPDVLSAKRYPSKDSESLGRQLRIISNNYKDILETKDDDFDKRLFGPILKVSKEQFDGLTFDEIYLYPVDLADGTPSQERTFHLI